MAEPASNEGFVGSVVKMGEEFAAVAGHSPEMAVLFALGALLTLGTMAVFGVLSAGAVLGALRDLLPSGPQPPHGR